MPKILLPLFLLFAINSFSQVTQNIKVTVLDAEDHSELPGASVVLEPVDISATTLNNGVVYFKDLKPGRYELKVSYLGYQKVNLKELLLDSSKELEITVKMKSAIKELDAFTISIQNEIPTDQLSGIHSMNNEEVMRFPATFFDPARLAIAFPGVMNQNDQNNSLSIRGNSPGLMDWWIEGAAVVNPNHLANAGTFTDRSSVNAGGVNMLSAQLLGAMNLMSGPYLPQYGNATAGIMDMRLRDGATDQAHQVIQLGLLGVDLAAEGPFKKGGSASYLMNYRYSFTGILGAMGIDFNGEKITFQDFSAKLSFPFSSDSKLSLYTIIGNNSNKSDKEFNSVASSQIEEYQKINYSGNTWIVGAKYFIKIDEKWDYNASLNVSQLKNDRSAEYYYNYIYNFNYSLGGRSVDFKMGNQFDFNQERIFSFNNVFTQKLNQKNKLVYGFHYKNTYLNLSKSAPENSQIPSFKLLSKYNAVMMPNLNLVSSVGERSTFQLGFNTSIYTALNSTFYFEPRVSFKQGLNKNSSITLAYGKSTKRNPSNYKLNTIFKQIPIIKSDLGSINFTTQIGGTSIFSAEAYYQSQMGGIGSSDPAMTYYSIFNSPPLNLTDSLNSSSKNRNYGVEFNYQYYLKNGFFTLANVTFFRSQILVNDEWTSSIFDTKKIINLTLGKEFKFKNNNILGINGKLNWMGGLYNYSYIDAEASKNVDNLVFDYSKPLELKNSDYVRPDLRIYFKIFKSGRSSMFSLDLQNFIGRQNEAYKYYSPGSREIVTSYQLGLIPMFNYRLQL